MFRRTTPALQHTQCGARVLIAAALAASALLAVACGGGASTGGGGGNALNVTITMTEFKFDPGTINATAGQTVNVTMVNKGSIKHTLVLPDLKITFSTDPGQTVTKSFTAPAAGTYKIECDEAGHKEAGMVGSLVVK